MKLKHRLYAILSFAILLSSSSHALPSSLYADEKTFVLRVTANEPANVIPFNATYMVITHQGASINNIAEVTPYEYSVNASFIGVMLEIAENNPNIKVDVIQKNENQDDTHLTGSGHAIFAHAATNGKKYILTS